MERVDELEAIWSRAAESVADNRQLWAASVEIALVAERDPAVRQQLGDALEAARLGLGTMVSGERQQPDSESTRALGSLALAVLEGLVLQQLIDPERAPSGTELAHALRSLANGSSRPRASRHP